MKLVLVSNNLVVQDIIYESDEDIDVKRINRPLSIEGENKALKLAKEIHADKIYASTYASSLDSAKYVSHEYNIPVYVNSLLIDSIIGDMGTRNIKMLRFMQERDFNFKFENGESLNMTKKRMDKVITDILSGNSNDDTVMVFTHKRAMLAYLLDKTTNGFNLDDRLILTYNDKVILDDSEKDIEIVIIDYDNKDIINIDTYTLGDEINE